MDEDYEYVIQTIRNENMTKTIFEKSTKKQKKKSHFNRFYGYKDYLGLWKNWLYNIYLNTKTETKLYVCNRKIQKLLKQCWCNFRRRFDNEYFQI